jgi:S1-C subfamily serine protease
VRHDARVTVEQPDPADPNLEKIAPIVVLANPGRCVGTATFLRPGLAVTASHVIDEMHGVNRETPWPLAGPQTSVRAWRVDQGRAVDWRVDSASGSPFTDVAYLHLSTDDRGWDEPPQDQTAIDLQFPQLGETLVAYGYPRTTVDTVTVDDTTTITVNYQARRVTGRVLEMHAQRDQTMYPFPVVRTDAAFDAGMSGGPVFDDDGRLRGLICGSAEGVPDMNYVALLWPSVFTPVDVSLPGEAAIDGTIAELASAGLLDVRGIECVRQTAANQVEWTFDRHTRMRPS